jgi:Ca-activated chloride channel family protein
MIGNLHFLRPEWLAMLPVGAVLAWHILRTQDASADWRHAIAPHLLKHLLVDGRDGVRFRPIHLTILLVVLGAVAAAGPTWRHERSPFVEDTAPLAVALDLSESMNATDVAPSRLERAKLKVRDLLALREGGRTALFAYSGTAHMVLPLTDDAKLVESYLDALGTDIMPVRGRNSAQALRTIDDGLAQEKTPGTLLFLTDAIEPAAFDAFARHRGGNEIMVLAIGTAEGGAARLDLDALQRLKTEGGVRLATVTADDADVRWIVRRAASHLQQARDETGSRWQDFGWWLTIPITLLAMFWFRKGWTVRWAAPALLAASVWPHGACAADRSFADLWLTPDQQGRIAFERGDFAGAAASFGDPVWKGAALYRAGRFAQAADAFASRDTAEAWFDRGNALAHLGKLPEAVTAYREALTRRPDWPDATANLKLLETLIAARPKNDTQGSNELSDKPDQVRFDKKGEGGKSIAVAFGSQAADVWMRNIRVSPADLLARRFSIEAGGGQ